MSTLFYLNTIKCDDALFSIQKKTPNLHVEQTKQTLTSNLINPIER
jgi:hypothetical protein